MQAESVFRKIWTTQIEAGGFMALDQWGRFAYQRLLAVTPLA